MPTSQATADLVFLPWLREGAAGAINFPDTLGSGQPSSATATIALEVNATPGPSVNVRLMGPGDVTGLDPRQVVRTDPASGARNFEPNHFPLIEFDRPSLPWLFTPASANAQAKLRPWLTLITVRKQGGVRVRPPRTEKLPVLEISAPANPAAELPDLLDSWAWAHAQVTAPGEAAEPTIRDGLARAELNVSRLICPRLLDPDTEYVACVVPAFALGRKAGLGEEIKPADETSLAPAWVLHDPTLLKIELPVYYHWEFATGAGGDFKSLALLLRPRPLPESVGRRPIDISASVLNVSLPARTALALEGALQPVNAARPTWPAEARQKDFQAALAAIVNAPALQTDSKEPLLAPPLYGSAQARRGKVDSVQGKVWFDDLNLDPMMRAVAGFGTRVIQQHQEALMASAWTQAGELKRVNQYLRQCQFGCFVSWSLYGRHLQKMAPEVGVQVMAPLQARLARSSNVAQPTAFLAKLRDTGLPTSAFSAPLRRLSRPRGSISRRVRRADPAAQGRSFAIIGALQPSAIIARVLLPATQLVSFDRIGRSLSPPRTDVTYAEATAAAVTAARQHSTFEFKPLGQPVPVAHTIFEVLDVEPALPLRPRTIAPRLLRRPGDDIPLPEPDEPPERPPRPVPVPQFDNPAAQAFRAAARAHLARFRPPPAGVALSSILPSGTVLAVFQEALARTIPGDTYLARAKAIVQLPATVGPQPDLKDLDPIPWAPQFPQPMSEPLAEISQDLMLPGLDAVPANTVLPLQTNNRFVQAYMVGLSAEMSRELLWREYPAPLDATFFDRFWDARSAPAAPPDIDRIGGWGDRPLGTRPGNPPGTPARDGANQERFVVLLRSELLRRYPNAAVYATRKGPPLEERMPMFSGALPPDVRFFGFDIPAAAITDWSIVIQEQPTEPRFGVDVGTDRAGATHLAPNDANAAKVARRVRRMPVRVTMTAASLLSAK
jgi:hypothetical protein